MATSPTQIVNLALSWMGQNQINNLTDNQHEAEVMDANYDLSRDKVLNDAAWTFATRRQILSPLAASPDFGFDNQFLIPSDVVFVHRVLRPESQGGLFTSRTRALPNANWQREGNLILANEAVIHCIFIIRVTNADLYPPAFIHALAARLAADTALTFTENQKMADRMEAMYEAKLAEAMYADGRQGRTEVAASKILTGTRRR
jgi:hypothetical protein